MNPAGFTGSSTTDDLENFVEKLKKVFEVMHVSDTERVEQAAYQLKGIFMLSALIWDGNRNVKILVMKAKTKESKGHVLPHPERYSD